MKRTIIAAGVLALTGGIFFMPNALATHDPTAPEPSEACGGAPVAQGTNSLTVCVTEGPAAGNLTASGDSADPAAGGYVVADGDSTNEGSLGGYIGVEGSGSGATVVSSGCDAPYAQENTGDEFDAAEFVDFVAGGGVSNCDADGHPIP